MAETHRTKVLIIGSGPAGYTAAIYAARASLKPLLVQGLQPGGQLTITTEVENYPGFADMIMGPELMEQMRQQAEKVGTENRFDIITDIDVSKRPFVCQGDSGDTYIADTVIVCTGAQARWLGLEGETTFNGKGVSACATCDGFFYRGREVAVIGGGNTAVEEALYLANICDKVTLVHRRDQLRAEKILQERLFKHEKIEVLWNKTVEEVLGTDQDGVTGLRLKDTRGGEDTTVDVSGMFVAIGHDPATKIFKDKLDMDDENYILAAPNSTRTNVRGIFAAGDCVDKVYRQAVTAAGMGCMAALEAERLLSEDDHAA
ncbi:thioredoxin-disulfide reductase [Kiloniella sp. b19]|uniref:thioredoxin-disulfide reductase n=1 Tax=Kiloniella sp. GXU_MW_B19 TaxID=3141326 RepID=UPI0031E41C06